MYQVKNASMELKYTTLNMLDAALWLKNRIYEFKQACHDSVVINLSANSLLYGKDMIIDNNYILPDYHKSVPMKLLYNEINNYYKNISKDKVVDSRQDLKNNSFPLSSMGMNSKVAIFIGCMGNYAYTNIGKSLLYILEQLQIDVLIPKKQLCCGAPAYFTGDFDTVDYLIKQNIEYFEKFIDDVDAIIIPEATCSAMIKVDYAHFFHNQPEWKRRAEDISPHIFMATDYLAKNTKLKEIIVSPLRISKCDGLPCTVFGVFDDRY